MPPSSTPAARSSTRPGFSSRFVHPSQTPSSSLPRTPFSSTAAAKPRSVDLDVVDDEDDDAVEDDISAYTVNRQRHQHVDADQADEDDSLPDVVLGRQLDRRPTAPQIQPTPNLPPSTAKRRKLSHFANDFDTIDNDDGPLSSSPPVPTAAEEDAYNHEVTQVQIPRSSPEIPYPDEIPAVGINQPTHHPSSDDLSPNNSPVKPITTPKFKTSRFRHPPPSSTLTPLTQHSNSTDQPFPSFQSRLLGATASSLRGPHPSLDYTLPDAFSPSRKKGQREYIRGGYAETVRGWVLDVAVRAGEGRVVGDRSGRPNDELTQTDGRDDGQMIVDKVLHRDRDGRFVVVRLSEQAQRGAQRHTEEGRVWILVNTDSQQPNRRNMSTSRLEMLQPGARIVVKGGEAMRWSVEFEAILATGTSLIEGQPHGVPLVDSSSESVEDEKRCHVAVLWEIVQ